MSTALVVFENKFPADRGQNLIVPAPSSGRLGTLPATLPAAMYPEAARSGWIVVERQPGLYGPDARMISTLSPGSIVDIHV